MSWRTGGFLYSGWNQPNILFYTHCSIGQLIPSTKGENYIMTKVVDFGQAERNARKRDLEIESEKIRELYNNVSEVELEKAMETIVKDTGKEL